MSPPAGVPGTGVPGQKVPGQEPPRAGAKGCESCEWPERAAPAPRGPTLRSAAAQRLALGTTGLSPLRLRPPDSPCPAPPGPRPLPSPQEVSTLAQTHTRSRKTKASPFNARRK